MADDFEEEFNNMPADQYESYTTRKDINKCRRETKKLVENIEIGNNNHIVAQDDINDIMEQIKTH